MLFALAQAIRWAQFPALAFTALVIALGSAICFGTEIVFIRDVFNNRMNTIFNSTIKYGSCGARWLHLPCGG